MVRDLLIRDFGIDLPISGGRGSSIGDPIIINTQSAHEASWIEMEYVRCICARFGWHWRAIGREIIDDANGRIERLSCEVKYPEDDQVITERRNFYFDISEVDLQGAHTTPICGINLGDTGMGLPYQLEWLHYDNTVNFEDEQPGMGVSAEYSAQKFKVSIYVYNKQKSQIDSLKNREEYEDEFSQSVSELISFNPTAILFDEGERQNVLLNVFDVDSFYTIITLSTLGNNFVKIRATLEPSFYGYVFDCFWESVNRILEIVDEAYRFTLERVPH